MCLLRVSCTRLNISLLSIDPPHTHRLLFFFFNDPATTEIYTLSLHDALPISLDTCCGSWMRSWRGSANGLALVNLKFSARSEEHTSELQSRVDLVCRLLLEKKKTNQNSLGHNKRSPSSDLARSPLAVIARRT